MGAPFAGPVETVRDVEDCANPALAAYLAETYPRTLPIVLGVMRDKDAAGIIAPIAARASMIVCTAASTPRALPAADLAARVREVAPDLDVSIVNAPRAALGAALTRGEPAVVAGSLYLAGEIGAEIS